MAISSDSRNQKKRSGNFKPKGRIADKAAIDDVTDLLPNHLQRDMLIEYLHLIQDKYSFLSAGHLTALAFIMKLPLSEVWEVASFYDHFILVKETQTPPPSRTIRVCTSLTCSLYESEKMLDAASQSDTDEVRYISAPCLGACDQAPVAADGHFLIPKINPDTLKKLKHTHSTKEKNT